ncbi:Isochorismatase hydrolase [Hortaea werneckii]|nr:Isochorismatase hydrolase [Hortaea werneckii]
MTAETTMKEYHGVIGNTSDTWLYSSTTGFDLTRRTHSPSSPVKPCVTVQTTTSPVTIDPSKSALVIIDMQNYFLSPAFGRTRGAGHDSLDQLVNHAIPAARAAGIRIIWLNWGLTEQEIDDLPPAVSRAFGFEVWSADAKGTNSVPVQVRGAGAAVNKHGEMSKMRCYKGLGSPCGTVEDPVSGKEIDAGRLLTRGAWNSDLYPPLDEIYREGSRLTVRPDVWIHKNRMSGMWGTKTECEEFLEREGIKTLMFSGVNTDQCVGGTYMDSFSKGYDCILLSDGAATTSPSFAQQCIEFNAANTWGFSTTCKALAEGVAAMGTS